MTTGPAASRGYFKALRIAIRIAAAILAAAPLAASAATVTLYPTANTTSGPTVLNPANVYAADATYANIPTTTSSSETVSGFASTNLGTISDVTVWVRYKTSAAPSNDTYAFAAATDGTTFSWNIVGANVTNQATAVSASLSLGALTWAQVGTLAVQGKTTKSGASDGYTLDWDVAYLVVTYTAPTPPAAPAAPTFGTIGTNSIQVNWTAVSGATTYKVDRSTDGTNFTNIASGVAGNSYTDGTGLSANSQYWYRITASNAGGDSSAGPSSSTYTLPNAVTSALSFPSVTTSSIQVSWTAPTGGASTYQLDWTTDGTFATGVTTVSGIATTSTTVSTLSAGTTYYFRVRPVNAGGGVQSTNSPTGTKATLPAATGAPTVAAVAGTTTLSVSWSGVTGAVSYTVQRSLTTGTGFADAQTGVTGTSWTDTTTSGNTTYYYRIVTVGASGSSAPSAEGSRLTLPGAPTLGALSATASSATVNWTAPVGGAASYRIERAPDSGGAPGAWAEVKAGQASSPWTDTTVASGTTYWYRVRATNTTGDGAYSANGSVTTQAESTSPSAPGTPTYSSVTSSTLTASWTVSTGTAPITYTLQWGSSGTGPWTNVTGCVGLSVGTCNVTGLQANTTYYYQVVATNSVGSTPSASSAVLTLPGQPALGAYTNVQSTLLRVNWSIAGSTSGLTYTVQRGSSASGPWVNVAACVATANTYCDDTGLTASTTYWYQVQATNARGSGAWSASTSVTTGAPFVGEGDNTPYSTKPAVAIINPISGTVGAHFKVQARVASPGGVAVGTVTLHYNAATVAMARNANYGSAVDSGVWEYAFPSLAAGSYTLQVEAANVNGAVFSRAVVVTIPASGQGDGNLLVRDNAAQLCNDCHALKSHGSDTTSSKYGSWSLSCRDCHTPHRTRNLGLVGERITPPERTAEQVPATVVYRNNNGWGTGGMANPELNGVCQVCHTQTSVYRSNGTDIDPNTGTPIASGGHNPTGNCVTCHRHDKGLKATCTTCHGTDGRTPTVTGADADLAAAPPALATPAATGAVANGAHLKHLDSVTYRSAPLQCEACHATKSHQDGKADVSWGTLAKSGGVTPTPATGPVDVAGWPTTPTCTNWCHGAALTGAAVPSPAWNGSFATVTCTQCHGTPPPVSSAAAEDHPQNTNCDACHGLFANAGYDFTNKTLSAAAKATHVDGTVQKPNKGCASCHGDLTVADGTSVLPGDPRAAPGYNGVGVDTTGASVRSDVSVGAHVKHVVDGMMPGNCTSCHSLPAQGDVLHANGSATVAFDALASKGVTTSWASPNCTVYCHSSGVPIGSATATPKNPVWTSTTALGCADCHAAAPATNAHGKHVTTYGVACQACHAATTDNGASIVTGGGLHVNGTNDVAFTTTDALWASYVTGGSYDTVGHTCGSTYCHSNGTSSSAPFGAPVSAALAWNATDACTSCHGGPSGAAVVMGNGAANGSAKHVKHVDNATLIGANYACGDCHKATVAAGTNAPITTAANHVDRVRTVSIANRGTYASADTTTTCSSTYCHSNGQRQFGTKLTVGWTDAAWTGNVCAKCHGTTTTTGAPDYVNAGPDTSTANSHAKHAPASTDCATCHNGYVTAAGTAIAGSSHTNGAINMGWDTTKAGTGVVFTAGTYTAPSTYTSATCANVKCHGYNATALKWGGPSMKCSDCHTSATADTDSFAFGTAGIINTTEWGATGHGQGTFGANTFPTIAAGTPCLYCHDGTVSHDVSGNPFRLRGVTGAGGAVTAGNYSASTTTSANQVCLNCHAVTGSNGVYLDASNTLRTSTKKIDAAHAGTKHTGTQNGGLRCWDCHDPHGDGNIKMVGKSVVKASTDNHSFAATRITGVTFTANATGTDYANTSATSLCRACHTATTGAAHYNATTNDGHNSGAKCVACHAHEQAPVSGFAQSTACNACHNAPPTLGKHLSHDETTFSETSYANNARHASATQYGFACNTCHNGTHQNSNNPYAVQVVFGSFDAKAVGGTYVAGTAQTGDTAPTGMLTYNWSGGTCNTTYCHSNGTPVQGAVLNGTPTWIEAAWNKTGTTANECTKCHQMAADNTGLATSTNLSHAHYVHTAATASSGYYFACAQCHNGEADGRSDYPASNVTYPASITDKTKHVNGARDVAFDATFNPGTTGYAQAPAYTCSNTYCHSNGTSAASPPANTSIAWNTSATCASCHGANTGTIIATGRHTNHVNNATIGDAYHCDDCHAATVAGGATPTVNYAGGKHVNRVKDVSIAARGTYTDTTDTGTTCSAAYCHSDGQRGGANSPATVTWADAAWTGNLCVKCHGTGGTLFGAPDYANGGKNTSTSNSHAKHVGAATDCATCHKNTTTTGAAILTGGSHTNGTIDVAFDTTKAGATATSASGTYTAPSTYVSATCTNVSCHGTNATAVSWGDTTLTCLNCHGTTGTEVEDLGATFWSNGTTSTINTTEWSYSGHGKTTGSYDVTGNPAANLPGAAGTGSPCLYCHDNAVTHQTATNPFRLRGVTNTSGVSAAYATTTSDLANAPCLNCHSTAANGVDPDGAATVFTKKTATITTPVSHEGAKHTLGTQGGKFCWDCHEPHGDRANATTGNIAMIRASVMTVSDGTYGYKGASGSQVAVNYTSEATGTAALGNATELVTASGSQHVGLCQACHAATSDTLLAATAWTKYWNRLGYDDPDGVGGTAPAASAHNKTSTTTPFCISCHPHDKKFAGAGGDCIGCHGATGGAGTTGANSRRPVSADFSKTSHHVGNGGANMGGTLTNFDCVVCHAEGTVAAGATGTSALHMDGKIDLRDADTAGTYYQYDTNAVRALGTTAANSGSATWISETSGRTDNAVGAATVACSPTGTGCTKGLDRFCLSCHDKNGASNSYTLGDTGATALNPFADTKITNEYDQFDRTRITDIASRVDEAAPDSLNSTTPKDRDSGYAPAGVIVRGADTRNDPPEGVFSRHAIRGKSTSVYGAPTTAWDGATQVKGTNGTYWNRADYAWASNSVMGCADCHTTDGANGATANAHGSTSEYLLKDGSGTAAIGGSTTTVVCAQCHLATNYAGGTHTNNGGDFQWYVSPTYTGTARIPGNITGGNVYGYACGNCHGGGPASVSGATFPSGSTGAGGFGTIHGTSQVFGTGSGGTVGKRATYRFMNGNSMRYYDPGDWTTTATRTCYTLSAGDATWGGCTKHAGGQSDAKISGAPVRLLNY